MSKLDRETVIKLCRLCRIEVDEEELDLLAEDLPKILDYVERLKEVDTEGVEPCSHVIGGLSTPFRTDEVGELLERDRFLANAPSHTAGMVRVPPVIKQGNS